MANSQIDSDYNKLRFVKAIFGEYNKLRRGDDEYEKFYREALEQVEKDVAKAWLQVESSMAKGEDPLLSDWYKFKRLENLEKNIQKTLKTLGKNVETLYNDSIFRSYRNIYQAVTNGIVANTEMDGNAFSVASRSQIEALMNFEWSGKNFSDRLWTSVDYLNSKVMETLKKSIVNGNTWESVSKEFTKVIGENGLYEAHRIVRTESMYILNQASKTAYLEAGAEKLQFYAAEDERTCKICGSLHEQIFDVDKEPTVPVHPHCRCVYIPIFE